MPLPPRPSRPFLLALLGGLAALAALPTRAAAPSPEQLKALEAALNGEGDASLPSLLATGPGLDPAQLEKRRVVLRQRFPDVRWWLRPGAPLADGKPTVLLSVTGTHRQGPTTYRLEGFQHLALESDGQRINGQKVLREQSLLRSGEEPLPVSLLIPDAVLTGQRYDVDVILDEPLDGALVAGGIVALSPDQVAAMENPSIDLGALAGGGLFKTVQAPFTPGSQTWSVLLVHPRGIISASKRVRVVSERAALTP
jgi:hypothetical protein